MKVTFLGTGTSHGVPMIGCRCPVCMSSDPRDKRWRSSILIEKDGSSVIIDTGYEFRLQAIRSGIGHLDAVIYTHAHSDHLMGLDDLRVFSCSRALPVYALEHVMDRIQGTFGYAFQSVCRETMGLPHLDAHRLGEEESFSVGPIAFRTIPVLHGRMTAAGFRTGGFAYIPDVSDILIDRNRSVLEGLDVLAIGALREEHQPTHYSFSEALEAVDGLGIKRILFTHICHSSSHMGILERYHGLAEPAYDTMEISIGD